MSNTNINGNWYETEVGKGILQKKYLHEGESFGQMLDRVSEVTKVSNMKRYLKNADFFPGGRSIVGAGLKDKKKVTTSNCFVLSTPKDTLESIFDTCKDAAIIGSLGGGVGLALDNTRPKGTKINNSAKESSGVEFVMNLLNETGQNIGQAGRHMAIMVMLDCNHPDIVEFLGIKQRNNKLDSMNISIKFTDEFMCAVRDNKEHTLSFTVESTGEHVERKINAKDFFIKFCECQHDWGDPGGCFIDKVKSYHLLSGYKDYIIDASNPCAEFFGNAGNACNLGSINLYNVIDEPFTHNAQVNLGKLQALTRDGIIALNNLLDYGYDMQPLDYNRKCIDDWRSIGLGVFGVADALIALGLRYGSDEANGELEDIMNCILGTSLETSCQLAKKYGTFGRYNWESTANSRIIKMYEGTTLYENIRKHGLRNGTLLSIAPAGTISTMCGVSNGCEPLFAISYERTTHSLEKQGKYFRVYAKSVEDLLKHHMINQDTITIDEIKKKFPFIVESHDISPEDRVRTQAVLQQYVDNAISSTVNLKNSATVQDVFNAYMLAWELGCKGLTIFRTGCKRGSILGSSSKEQMQDKHNAKFNHISPIKRGNIKKINGSTMVGHTACVKNLYTTVNTKDNNTFEVFTNVSSGCKSNINTITRLVSLALRCGVKVDEVIHELKANICPACSVLKQQGKTEISGSCGTCIAEAIEEVYQKKDNQESTLAICPECGKNGLVPTGRCVSCSQCGWSRCG